MNTYLLLRSNRQSGPYSFEQLVSFGLKPYDLVWVEGKSAAWRYPSEVDGLKDYAPATEEQPFDRFYKKPEERQQATPQPKMVSEPVKQYQPEEIKSQPNIINRPIQQPEETKPQQNIINHPIQQPGEAYSLPIENNTVTTGKKVFVSMPESHGPKRSVQPIAVKAPVIVEEKPKIIEERRIESKPAVVKEEPVINEKPALQKPVPVFKEQTISAQEEPTLNEKYSESLDDIKRRYTETYLNRKKRSKWTSTHTSLVQVFGGAIFFCFLVVVAYKNFSGEETTQSRTTVVKPDKRAINTSTVSTTPVTIPAAATETNEQQAKKKSQSSVKEALNPPDESLAINTGVQSKDGSVNASEFTPVDKNITEKKTAITGTEESNPEEVKEVKPKIRRVNINRQVSVRANNYKQRAFGGVMNLELTVDNDSKFDLDKVIIELQYLKPSEQPIKTERIVFNSIDANGSKTIKVPDYLRGVKVAYRVMEIESSQYDRQTAGL